MDKAGEAIQMRPESRFLSITRWSGVNRIATTVRNEEPTDTRGEKVDAAHGGQWLCLNSRSMCTRVVSGPDDAAGRSSTGWVREGEGEPSEPGADKAQMGEHGGAAKSA